MGSTMLRLYGGGEASFKRGAQSIQFSLFANIRPLLFGYIRLLLL